MSHIPETTVIEDMKMYAVAVYTWIISRISKHTGRCLEGKTHNLALSFGVNDIDGTIDDSTKIYSMAGAEEQNPSMTTEAIGDLDQAGEKKTGGKRYAL